jgi:hypothetical protein
MTLADAALVYLAIGLALFLADLAFTPRAEFVDLWRYTRERAGGPAMLVLGLSIGVAVSALNWCLTWPFRIRAFFRNFPTRSKGPHP